MAVGYVIVLHPLVVAVDIPSLDTYWRTEIRHAIRTKLATQPELFGKPLRQSLKGYRSLRVGDYRVVYEIRKKIIRVIIIGHRSDVYELTAKRAR